MRKIHDTLPKFGIGCKKLVISARKGYVTHEGYVHNGDYWIMQISKKIYLLRLLNSLRPYIKHGAKIKALEKAIANIRERNRKFGNINMGAAG